MGSLAIKCGKCGHVSKPTTSEFGFELIGTNPDRQMGAEYFYEATYEFNCPKCRNVINITSDYSEYPAGSPHWSGTNVENGQLVGGP